jgi:hypothetical protein
VEVDVMTVPQQLQIQNIAQPSEEFCSVCSVCNSFDVFRSATTSAQGNEDMIEKYKDNMNAKHFTSTIYIILYIFQISSNGQGGSSHKTALKMMDADCIIAFLVQ